MELNKIDVIVSLYNKENEIKDCLLSILRQSKLPNKVIVVNNNSTDRSKIIVEEMIKESENTILELINENKQGAQYARFTGVEHSDSDFITFLDADDSILNDHLKTINDLINKYENFDVFCSSYIFRKNKKLSKSRNINSLIVTRNKKEFFLKYFFNRGMICSSNITFRKSLVSKQWIESNDRIGEDLSIWYNIISNVKFVCIDKNTVIINKTPLSANSNSIQKNESELIIKKTGININMSTSFFEKMVHTRRIIYVDFFKGSKYLLKNFDKLMVVIFLESTRVLILKIKKCF